jgi:hypothetical protein
MHEHYSVRINLAPERRAEQFSHSQDPELKFEFTVSGLPTVDQPHCRARPASDWTDPRLRRPLPQIRRRHVEPRPEHIVEVRQVVEAAGPRNVRNLASGLDGILKHADAEALQEYTRERVPLEWAMTQNNLGNALRTLGGSRWRSRNTTTAPRRVLLSDVDERALGF